MSDAQTMLWVSIGLSIFFFFYLLPTIIAFRRKHPNRYVIAVINVAGGLTGFGWLLSLLWSMHAIHRSEEEDGSHGGESGLNVDINDISPIRVSGPDVAGQIADLKRLLDEGAINQSEFSKLKAQIIG